MIHEHHHPTLGVIKIVQNRARPAPRARPLPRFARVADKINVGVIQSDIWMGGAVLYTRDILKLLDKSVFHVVGVAAANDWTDDEVMKSFSGLCPISNHPDAAGRIHRVADVVLVWGVPDVRERVGPPGRARYIYTAHGCCEWTAKVITPAVERTDTHAITFVSRQSQAAAPKGWNGKTYLTYGSIDPNRLIPKLTRPEQRRAWGLDDRIKVALHVARPSPEKRVGLCYRSLPPGWAYVSVGSSPFDFNYQNDARDHATGPVVWAGRTDDIGSALHAADCLLLPSSGEGCALAALEAHAVGLPVVATPLGLYWERPDLALIVPEPPTTDDLGRVLGRLGDDPGWARGTVARAREWVYARCLPEHFAKTWSAIIRDAAPPPPPRARGIGDTFGRYVHKLGYYESNGCQCEQIRKELNQETASSLGPKASAYVHRIKDNARQSGALSGVKGRLIDWVLFDLVCADLLARAARSFDRRARRDESRRSRDRSMHDTGHIFEHVPDVIP